ncbi:MAG: molybdopterin molybdotransferase MoeA, partial [Flavobacteriaceae bacterium]|nr:molybdopterin molybdotransferase MoeA [Flavobacteriaceae bacterium]
GRILAEDILAQRDFPPFDRSTKDGIAISFSAWEKGQRIFKIEDIAAAGQPQKTLSSEQLCMEIMTGAVIPDNTDTVIMYEEIEIENGEATISSNPNKGQNIHRKGTDQKQGNLLLPRGHNITTSSVSILATEGIHEPKVKQLPSVAILTTGTELVDINETPNSYQIRRSNSYTLQALLKQLHIRSNLYHESDDKQLIKEKVQELLENYDVLLMSGGVSMGKYDFLPEVLENLGVNQIFHKVAQRPGKPFWFGTYKSKTIFSFPGNPVSTYVNFHIYFKPWLAKCLGVNIKEEFVTIDEEVESNQLTRFRLVKFKGEDETVAELISSSGSGDLVSLVLASGVVEIPSNTTLPAGSKLKFIRF